MLDDHDPDARFNDEPSPNPFTPISYDERLRAPLKHSERGAEDMLLRPGQFYTGAYDKWMSRPAPLEATDVTDAYPRPPQLASPYGQPTPSKPLRFHEPAPRPDTGEDYGGAAPPASSALDIPGYLKRTSLLAPRNTGEPTLADFREGGGHPHDAPPPTAYTPAVPYLANAQAPNYSPPPAQPWITDSDEPTLADFREGGEHLHDAPPPTAYTPAVPYLANAQAPNYSPPPAQPWITDSDEPTLADFREGGGHLHDTPPPTAYTPAVPYLANAQAPNYSPPPAQPWITDNDEATAPRQREARRSRSRSQSRPQRRRRADRREAYSAYPNAVERYDPLPEAPQTSLTQTDTPQPDNPQQYTSDEYREPISPSAWDYPQTPPAYASHPNAVEPYDPLPEAPQTSLPQTDTPQPDNPQQYTSDEYREPISPPAWDYPQTPPAYSAYPNAVERYDPLPEAPQTSLPQTDEPVFAGFMPESVESYVTEQPFDTAPAYASDEVSAFFSDGVTDMPAEEPQAAVDYASLADEAPTDAVVGQPERAESAAPLIEAPKKPVKARRIRPWRLVALISIISMVAFVLIAGGSILSDLARNKQEMSDFREAYREQRGVSPEQDGHMVALLPFGQTFVPSATPPISATPPPDADKPAVVSDNDALNATGATAEADEQPTSPPRTRITAYPDNPLRNIIQSIASLRDENPDIMGRIVIDGVLDEVVVQRNNTFYLTHNYHGSSSRAGAVFIDESCSLKTPPENLLLRGQDVQEGKSFAPLWRFSTGGSAFVSTATRAKLTTLYEEREYVLFAVIETSSQASQGFNYAGYPSFATDEEMLAHVDVAMRQSQYKFNVSVEASDRLLTLATVGASDKTLVLMYRMVRDGERQR